MLALGAEQSQQMAEEQCVSGHRKKVEDFVIPNV